MKRLLCAAILVGAAALPFVGVGCGPSYHKVEVKVTLDGEPVEGATVSFLPDGDSKALQASGSTNAQGIAVLKTVDKDGVRAGKYKVTVSKVKGAAEGMDDPNMSAADKMKKALDKSKEQGGAGPGGGGPPPGMKMPGGMMPGGGGAGAAGPGGNMGFRREELLPPNYSDAGKTPFSVTVPVSDQPVKLEMKKSQ